MIWLTGYLIGAAVGFIVGAWRMARDPMAEESDIWIFASICMALWPFALAWLLLARFGPKGARR